MIKIRIKYLLCITLIFSLVFVLSSCNKSDEGSYVTGLSFTRNTTLRLDGNDGITYLKIESDGDISKEMISFSISQNIANVSVESLAGNLAILKIVPISNGDAEVLATYENVQSQNTLKISISGITKTENADATDATKATGETSPTEISPIEPSTNISDSPPIEEKFVLNTNTQKIHREGCSYAAKIREENRLICDNPDSYLAEGYEWCKRCK